ncbi:MAG: phenylalanine--tRNA ligase subunit beta [Thermoanaerobaculia bacterium]
MKISRDWLSDYVDVSALTDDQLGAKMTEIGHAIESVESHEGDTVFDVEFTTNRIDAMSHFGLARELAAALGKPLIAPKDDLETSDTDAAARLPIRVDAPELCSRYTGLVVRGVTVGPSSDKIRRRLEAVGLRPINNIVDATNYMMMAFGHPLHAFDLARLEGPAIVVRRGSAREKVRTLDGIDREIDSDTVVIADAKRAVALGGVMGGANSEIGESTKGILLECAHFDPSTIRRTSRKLGLASDAAYRFERGVDPNDTVSVVRRTAALVLAEGGGTAYLPIDVVARPIKPGKIVLRESTLNVASAGVIDVPYAVELFGRLGMPVRTVDGGIEVTIPTYRVDLGEEADLIEEVIRFYGIDRIPSALPRVTTGDTHHDVTGEAEDAVRDVLQGCGLVETISYSFIHREQNRLFSDEAPIDLENALTENISSMRLSMLPGLLDTVAHNRSYGIRDGGIFEVGRIYRRFEGCVREEHRAGVVLWGNATSHWGEARREVDFFDAKGILEAVAGHWHIPVAFEAADVPWMRKGQSGVARAGGRNIGVAGFVAREVLQKFEIKGDVAAIEIDLDALMECVTPWKMEPVSRFPGVPMVLGLMHGRDLTYETIASAVRSLEIPHLQEVGLWDRFVPDPAKDEIKTALGMWYQAFDRSLTQDEVAALHRGIGERLATMLPVRVIG